MIVNTSFMIIVFAVTLLLVLLVFGSSIAEILTSQQKFEEDEGISKRVSGIVLVAGEPRIMLESCATDAQRAEFSYKFRISGLEAFFQGVPGAQEKAGVFATLAFKDKVVRDSSSRVVTMTQGVAEPFGVMEFDVKSGKAPFILKPDAPAESFLPKGILPEQSVVLNNYRITPIRQFQPILDRQPLGTTPAGCYTDFFVECRKESGRASLTSCTGDLKNPDNPGECKAVVTVCGGRVDLTLYEYKQPARCGSRPIGLAVNTNKQADGWEYADTAVIHFWESSASQLKPGETEACWQKGYTESCRDKYLGAQLFNLSVENYNVGGC